MDSKVVASSLDVSAYRRWYFSSCPLQVVVMKNKTKKGSGAGDENLVDRFLKEKKIGRTPVLWKVFGRTRFS